MSRVSAANTLFDRGTQAMQKGNHDYAIGSFRDCCKLVPGHLTYRQALRMAQYRKWNNNGTGVSGMGKAGLMAAKGKLKVASTRKKWDAVCEAAEDVLTLNPWDVEALYGLSYALKELGHPQVAAWNLENSQRRARDAKNARVFLLLADLWEALGEYEKSIEALETVKEIAPDTKDIQSRKIQLSAASTHKRAEQAKKDEEAGVTQQRVSAGSATYEDRMKHEASQLEARAAEEPTNASLQTQVGDIYRKLGNYEKAIMAFKKALKINGPTDIDSEVSVRECHLAMLREKLESFDKALAAIRPDDDDGPEKKKVLTHQRTECQAAIEKQELELFRRCAESRPDDYEANYELGIRLLEHNLTDEAIKVLQYARRSPALQVESQLQLGKAFFQKKNYQLAESNFQAALQECTAEDEENRKEILYSLARSAEERGDGKEAIDYLNRVAALDYSFRDVSERLDQLMSQQA